MPRAPNVISKRTTATPTQATLTTRPTDNGSSGHAASIDPSTLFLRLPTVMRLTGLGRSTIYRLVANQGFPMPVKLAARAVAWRRGDIEAWSQTRPVSMH